MCLGKEYSRVGRISTVGGVELIFWGTARACDMLFMTGLVYQGKPF